MVEKQKSQEPEAEEYIKLLQTDGVNVPVDDDVDSYDFQLPEWYDENLFKKAQKFNDANLFAMFAGKLCGLISVLSIPSILKILVHTKQSSEPVTAYKRYIQTVFHVLVWYGTDLKPGSKSWKSLQSVRKTHGIASKYTNKENCGFITQRDMALTQFGFMGFIISCPEKLGIQLSHEDLEAFVHFWRVIGHMVGIKEHFNLCTDSYKTTKKRVDTVRDKIFRPLIENTNETFYKMATAMIDGLWCYNPFLDTDAFLYFTKWMCNCKNYVYYRSDPRVLDTDAKPCIETLESLGYYSRLILYLQLTAHTYWLNFAAMRWYLNFQLWTSKYILYYFPFLAFYKFGINKSYVRIFKKDKST